MVYQKISDDLKETALWLMACGCDTVHDIAAVTGFSVWTLYCAHHWKLPTGSVAKAEAIGLGQPRTLARRDCDYLLRLAWHKPTLFLDEYSQQLEQHHELSVSLATIHQTLEHARLNIKHVQKMAAERDPFLYWETWCAQNEEHATRKMNWCVNTKTHTHKHMHTQP